MARAGRAPQSERVAHQGRRSVQHHLERGLHRRLRPRSPSPSGWRPARSSTTFPRPPARGRRASAASSPPTPGRRRARTRARKREQALLGVFDEGCMGMFNAIIPDHLLHPLGLFKERLSQSALYAAMLAVPDATARRPLRLAARAGDAFRAGRGRGHRTDRGAGARRAPDVRRGRRGWRTSFGCAAIGIQYQQGLKDTCVASDLAEGLLNNPDRPPVLGADDGAGSSTDGRCRTSMRWTSAPASTRSMTNRVWIATRHRSVDHAARRAVGRAGGGARRGRVRLGVRDLRRRAGLALHRRLRRRHG